MLIAGHDGHHQISPDQSPDGGLRARLLPHLKRALVAALFFVGTASAQERPALNEFTTWFGGQFANKHAFSDTVDGRLYQLENRYSRLVYAGGPFAVRWVAEIVPMTLVGDPWHTKGRQYAYGGGGSPIGAQVNWVHYRRIQPFLTSGGGFLYFNRSMFKATHFNFTANTTTFLTPTSEMWIMAWTHSCYSPESRSSDETGQGVAPVKKVSEPSFE